MPPTAQTDVISYKRFSQKITEIASKPRNRTYSMIIFSLIAITLLGWFAIRPTIHTILELEREIGDKTKLDERMDAKIASLIQAQEDYNNLLSRLPLLSQAVPEEPEIMKYLSALKQIGDTSQMKSTGLSFTNVSLATGSAEKPAPETGEFNPASPSAGLGTPPQLNNYPITINIQGPYENLRTYLNALANMRRITTLSSLEIKAGSDGEVRTSSGSGRLLDVMLQLVTYFQHTE